MNQYVYKSEKAKADVEAQYTKILSECNLQFNQILVRYKDSNIHILQFGNIAKPALFLLHGTLSSSLVWLGIIQDFTADFCLYCIDTPGEPGLSSPYRIPLDSEDSYKWLVCIMDELRIQKCSILSMSLGSWFAMNLAIHAPDRIQAVSILTTSGVVPAKADFLVKAVICALFGRRGKDKLNKMIYYNTIVVSEAKELQDLITRSVYPMLDPIPIFTDAQLSNVNQPVQYFGGDHDVLIDTKKTANRLALFLKNVEINILPNTGHVILNQYASIHQFLQEHNL